jgi:hypothetical protein
MVAEPVFICGLYKCGTSWLLAALSAHPDVTGLAEVDIIRAACDVDRSSSSMFRGRSPALAPVAVRMGRFFGRCAWCRLPVEAVEQLERGDYRLPEALGGRTEQSFGSIEPRVAVSLLHYLRAGADTLPLDFEGTPTRPRKPNRRQSFYQLSPSSATELFERIRSAGTVDDALEAMVEVNAAAGGTSRLVFKGADQVAVFETLQRWRPRARKIAIVRDGRDAAISALHYRALMKAQSAPWYGGESGYGELVSSWANRAGMAVDLARAGRIYLLRYEDLTVDFAGTLRQLLAWMEIDRSDAVIDAIEQASSFEAATGRRRGEEARHLMRKGAIREWVDALDDRAKDDAWQTAGSQLAALGYTRHGELEPLCGDLTTVTSPV